MAKPPAVEQTFYYAVPPAEVFAALSEPKGLRRWFLEDAVLQPKRGTSFRFTWRGGYTMKGKVLRARAGRSLELAWVDKFGGKVFKTAARFDLARKGSGTVLQLTHRGFKSGKKWTALYGAVGAGWAYYLTNLRSVLEHGVDLRSDLDEIS